MTRPTRTRHIPSFQVLIILRLLLHRKRHRLMNLERTVVVPPLMVRDNMLLTLRLGAPILFIIIIINRAAEPIERFHGILLPSSTGIHPAPATTATAAAVGAVSGALVGHVAPAREGGEGVAQQGVDDGQVGDVNGDGGFAVEPVEVLVRDERRVEAVQFAEDGGRDDEDAHAEDADQDQLLLEGDLGAEEERKADEEEADVGGDVEAAFDDGVVMVGPALFCCMLSVRWVGSMSWG